MLTSIFKAPCGCCVTEESYITSEVHQHDSVYLGHHSGLSSGEFFGRRAWVELNQRSGYSVYVGVYGEIHGIEGSVTMQRGIKNCLEGVWRIEKKLLIVIDCKRLPAFIMVRSSNAYPRNLQVMNRLMLREAPLQLHKKQKRRGFKRRVE